MQKPKRTFILLVVLAILVKLAIFSFIAIHAPQEIFEADSDEYVKTGQVLLTEGKFAIEYSKGVFSPHIYRTPGYPLFFGILHVLFKIPYLGVIFVHIILTVIASFVTYKAAMLIDEKLAPFSALIVLFEPAVTVYSMMLLTEALFLLLISLFMYVFLLFIKTEKLRFVIISTLILVVSTYVRPVSYYMPVAMVMFLIMFYLRKIPKQTIIGVFSVLAIFISLIAPWHLRNIKLLGINKFSTISNATVSEEYGTGLYKSYVRNKDPISQGLPPVAYYANVSARCLMSLYTRPANLKYFGNKALKVAGQVFSYPWNLFWLIGFIVGLAKMRGNRGLYFIAFILLYFTVTTVIATMWGSGPRFRVPMTPFIAILTAHGWSVLRKSKENVKK